MSLSLSLFSLSSLESALRSILSAIIIYLIGKFAIGFVCKLLKKLLGKFKIDPMIHSFIISGVKAILWLEVVLSIMNCFGVNTGSLITVLAAAGAAIALALQNHLSNLAGGIIIMLTHPFKKGDYITGQGSEGTVESIDLFYTTIVSADNQVITIPNGGLATGTIKNSSEKETRRLDLEIGVSYDSDAEKVKKLLIDFMQRDARILKEPAVFCAVKSYDDSAVVFVLRGWCNTSDYWGLKFDLQTAMKGELEKAGISIPYPQMDVNLKQSK